MNTADKSDALILKIAEATRNSEKPLPTSLTQIPKFPFDNFDQLLSYLRKGDGILQRFSINYDADIYTMFASTLEKNLHTFLSISAFLFPFACIALAFIQSIWWIAGIPYFFFALGKSKKLYNRVILKAALKSELNFCFLYATKQVCLTTPDYEHSLYWGS